METDKIIFIYGLIDPRNEKVRYVGWTSNLKFRFSSHIFQAKNGYKNHRCNWIRQLLSNNLEPRMIVLEETIYSLKVEKEQYWIKYYGRENLTNATDGGEGVLGYVPSEEARKKSSESHKGRPSPLKGKRHTLEAREKMSKSRKGKPSGRKGKIMSDEQKLKISNANKGKPHSNEWNKKVSLALSGEGHYLYGKKREKRIKEKIVISRLIHELRKISNFSSLISISNLYIYWIEFLKTQTMSRTIKKVYNEMIVKLESDYVEEFDDPYSIAESIWGIGSGEQFRPIVDIHNCYYIDTIGKINNKFFIRFLELSNNNDFQENIKNIQNDFEKYFSIPNNVIFDKRSRISTYHNIYGKYSYWLNNRQKVNDDINNSIDQLKKILFDFCL